MAFTARFQDSLTRKALRAYLAEFISTFLYVFAVIGSTMSSRKMKGEAAAEAASLVGAAIANSFALSTAVFMAWDVSGGHVNPAVTFARVVGGHLTLSTAFFYWIAQMIASVVACLLLKITFVGMHVPTYTIAPQMTGFGASIVEGVLTFALVYTVYAARDPRRSGQLGSTGALSIGLIAGANVLAAGPFSGGSMNPACAFGSATVAGTFKNQAVYWVGPLIGAAVAALIYDTAGYPSPATDTFVEVDRV
ncbi:hypothetical protein K1719_013501 [Acacia pycnantha]|nr:hypothetical protein K1719_013501 [Acacia pycnantha]